MANRDDVIERVARTIADCISPNNPAAYREQDVDCRRQEALAALAALQPGDEIGDGRWVGQGEVHLQSISDIARQSAEDMREACVKAVEYCKGGWAVMTDLDEAIRAIRSLPLPGETKAEEGE